MRKPWSKTHYNLKVFNRIFSIIFFIYICVAYSFFLNAKALTIEVNNNITKLSILDMLNLDPNFNIFNLLNSSDGNNVAIVFPKIISYIIAGTIIILFIISIFRFIIQGLVKGKMVMFKQASTIFIITNIILLITSLAGTHTNGELFHPNIFFLVSTIAYIVFSSIFCNRIRGIFLTALLIIKILLLYLIINAVNTDIFVTDTNAYYSFNIFERDADLYYCLVLMIIMILIPSLSFNVLKTVDDGITRSTLLSSIFSFAIIVINRILMNFNVSQVDVNKMSTIIGYTVLSFITSILMFIIAKIRIRKYMKMTSYEAQDSGKIDIGYDDNYYNDNENNNYDFGSDVEDEPKYEPQVEEDNDVDDFKVEED